METGGHVYDHDTLAGVQDDSRLWGMSVIISRHIPHGGMTAPSQLTGKTLTLESTHDECTIPRSPPCAHHARTGPRHHRTAGHNRDGVGRRFGLAAAHRECPGHVAQSDVTLGNGAQVRQPDVAGARRHAIGLVDRRGVVIDACEDVRTLRPLFAGEPAPAAQCCARVKLLRPRSISCSASSRSTLPTSSM